MELNYAYLITVRGGVMIPTDPMTDVAAVAFRKDAQPLIDAGFFLNLTPMVATSEGWVKA